MKKNLSILIFSILLLASCSTDNPVVVPDKPVDNYLVEAQQTGVATKEFLALVLNFSGYQDYAEMLNSNVKAIRVTYNTLYKGSKLVVSGVFCVSENFDPQYPTVIYEHGTILENEAPSLAIADMFSYTQEVALCMALASIYNCAVLLPDYIGYGVSASITHPYLHSESIGQASLDMIRAFKEYTADPESQLSFNNNVFITGYSEGGYAAVALQKKIQEASTNLRIEKVVAGSGPYDNVGFAKECLGQTTDLGDKFISSYLWTIGMYKNDYGYSKNYNAMFSDADNALLQASGYDFGYFHPMGLAINTNPSLLFKTEFINGVLLDTDTELLSILAENSLTNFTPSDSLIFVYGTADDWVYPLNTINAYNAMSEKGCKVKCYIYPNGDHITTLSYYLDVLFERLQMLSKLNNF
ncbi:MAG: hypothetical protein LBO69_00460 [Ignavibacteria bacterium]|jgi:hypothetical protein|nr:hypothetical protein [Ignavibacteria bacterium]